CEHEPQVQQPYRYPDSVEVARRSEHRGEEQAVTREVFGSCSLAHACEEPRIQEVPSLVGVDQWLNGGARALQPNVDDDAERDGSDQQGPALGFLSVSLGSAGVLWAVGVEQTYTLATQGRGL